MHVICRQISNEKPKTDIEQKSEERHGVICMYCHYLITYPDNQIAVNGSFRHVFANPHGYVFEIGCFSDAEGCRPASELSSEFSWFQGFSWKITVCRQCFAHLGWMFVSEKDRFFGLIIEKLLFP